MKKRDRNTRDFLLLSAFIRCFKMTKFTLIAFIFCMSIPFATAASSQTARVTIRADNLPVREIIQQIENQTSYLFVYNNKVDLSRKTTLNESGISVTKVLTRIFDHSDITYVLEGNNILLMKKNVAGQKSIAGTVKDANGEPIIGANITEKGKNNGTISDINGTFSLNLSDDKAVLVVSYIGYVTKEVPVGNRSDFQIVMQESSEALDEVVVVGYGTERKVNVIGSIAQVSGEKLHTRPTPMLSNALTGQMAGVTVIQRSGRPGQGGGQIRVRGVGSFGGEDNKSDALVLVDGIPGNLNHLNAEDIESISVLKDASTAAIYGSRAANGVILVTTKTGKDGKISVNYNGYVGFNTATELPEFVDTWQYASLYNEAVGKEIYTADEIQKLKDGSDPDHYSNSRYLDEVFSRKGLQHGHNLTVNGGNTKNKYMISFGYMRQNGLVKKNDYTRYNARVNLVNEIVPRLKLTTRLSGTYGERNEPSGGSPEVGKAMMSMIELALRHPGIWPTVLTDGTYGPGPDLSGTPPRRIPSKSFYTNPQFSVNANLRLDYNPIDDLNLAAIGAYTYTNAEEKDYRSSEISAPSLLIHKMTKTIYKTFQATVDYNKTIGNHSFGLLAGYSWEQQDYTDLNGSRDKFPGNDLLYLNAGSPDNQKASGSGNAWALQSLFGRIKYNFGERYLLESTLRYDGSSRFPENRKYGFFPSLAMGWRISEESFVKDNPSLGWITNLKLKTSWGRLGNQNIGNYPYQSVYELGQNYPFGEIYNQGAAIKTATDPTIKWEETETIDGGFESVLWNGLLSFNMTYFYRKTYDILYKPGASVSSVLGLKISEMNTGKLKNQGLEFEVGHRNKIGNVSYNINANLTIIRNKLLTLGVGNVDQLNGMVGNGSDLFVGQPIQMYYGYLTDGVFLDQADIESWYDQSKITPAIQPGDIRYKDISGPDGVPDGIVDPNYDRVPLGSRIPKYTFGLNAGAEYKGFDVSVLIQGVAGVKGLLENYAGYAFRQNGNIQVWQAEGRFDPENPTRYPAYPRLEELSNTVGPNIQTSDFWILDASYVRLKNVQLGYSLPKKMMKAARLGSLRVYVQAENPFTWKKYRKGWDPEINTGGQWYPILATYTFGVNFNF